MEELKTSLGRKVSNLSPELMKPPDNMRNLIFKSLSTVRFLSERCLKTKEVDELYI